MRILKYLFLIMLVTFISVSSVNAESTITIDTTNAIKDFHFCNIDGSCSFNVSPSKVDFYDGLTLFHGATFNKQTLMVQFNFNSSNFSSLKDNDTLSFYLYDGRSEFMYSNFTNDLGVSDQYSINGSNFGALPLVTWSDKLCTTNIYGYTGNDQGDGSFEKRFFITCPFSESSSLNPYMRIFYRSNNTTASARVAISNNILVTPSSQTTIQDIEQGVGDLNQGVNDLNDNLTNDNIDSSDSTINNLKDKIPTNSVISDLLLLPVRFLQNFVNALSSSCSNFSLGSLYGTELFMPCINIENYLGSGIWTTIDLIISGLFIYSLRKKFIEIYENLTNLQNGGNEID